MPIKIPNDLPAKKVLEGENIFVMTETRAITQDIRPLKILILKNMLRLTKNIVMIEELQSTADLSHVFK